MHLKNYERNTQLTRVSNLLTNSQNLNHTKKLIFFNYNKNCTQPSVIQIATKIA